jgi:hypothetical protein
MVCAPLANARVVVFAVYDGMRLLDLTGPLDSFAIANDVAKGPAPYALRTVSVNGGPVRTSSGLTVSTEPLSALDGAAIDTLIVGGGAGAFRACWGVRRGQFTSAPNDAGAGRRPDWICKRQTLETGRHRHPGRGRNLAPTSHQRVTAK